MDRLANVFGYFLSSPLELIGLASGLLCVWLLIRQHLWAWPIGLVYSVVSVAVFLNDRLYASMLESGYYVLANAYGWYFWLRGRGERGDGGALRVTTTPRSAWLPLAAITVAGGAAVGWLLDTRTDAALAYWDSAAMVMAFVAMWMTARKYIENWIVWLVVDVVKTGVYVAQGVEPYALLYGVYVVMAGFGWVSWSRSMKLQAPAP